MKRAADVPIEWWDGGFWWQIGFHFLRMDFSLAIAEGKSLKIPDLVKILAPFQTLMPRERFFEPIL